MTDRTAGTEAPGGIRAGRYVIPLVAVATIATAGAVLWPGGEDTGSAEPAPVPAATVPVTSGAMVDATDVRGTLRFSGDTVVSTGSAGVLTSLPAPGAVIAPGDVLFTVDTRPVVLMTGTVPAWRTFETGMSDGEDVRQLEQNLGSFTREPDTRFTAATATAVRAWQRQLGVQATGVVERSAIRFSGGPLRLAEVTGRPGADVVPGTELYRATGTDKIVDVDLDLDDQQLAVPGAAVTVSLPDGSQLPARVAGVGEAVERPGTDGGSARVVVPVTVALDDQSGASRFPRADVAVTFTSTLGQDLLTVPVEALIAVDATSFGVEVPDPDRTGETRIVAVQVGAFASGRVAVTGQGIVAGLDVVVPS